MKLKKFPERLLFIISWPEKGEWSLLRDLQELFNNVDVLQPLGLRTNMSQPFKLLSSKLSAIYLPILVLLRYKSYDLIVSYSIRSGTVFGILKRIMGCFISMPFHIVRDFHINLAEANRISKRFKYSILSFAIPGMDMLLVTSSKEVIIYSELFKIPQDRIRFYPDGAPTLFLKYQQSDKIARQGRYVFSYGNSDRDYEVLIKAMQKVDFPCIILSQTYRPSSKLPNNVRLIKERVSKEQMMSLILGSAVTVIPTYYYNVAAGQNSILEAMALAKPVIATKNFASLEYGKNEESIIFVPPADSEAMSRALKTLLDNKDLSDKIGRKAKEFALASSAELVNIFCGFIEEVLPSVNKGKLVRELEKVYSKRN